MELFFGCSELGEFVVDVLLDSVGVRADDAAAIDEDGWRAADLQEIAVGDAGCDFGGGLGSGEAGFERILIEIGLPGEVENLVVDG